MPERERTSIADITMDREQACAVLGVKYDSDWSTVRSAYSHLIKRYHPDTGGNGDGETLSRIVEAYRFLSENGATRDEGSARVSAVFALGEQAVSGTTARERAFACSRLASLGRKSASSYLQRALFDTDERVAVAAAEGLGRIRSVAASESMRIAFRDGGPNLKAAIVEAAYNIGAYPCFRPLVVAALRTPSPRWRATALRLYFGMSRSGMSRGEGNHNGRSS